MSPFYAPGSEDDKAVEDRPHFRSPEEVARHQAENLRQAIGDELWEWLKEITEGRNERTRT